mmetsp:Transcript_6795/g.12562  ORF Transcript_6795/g.12562 Transcript_6795/m.12562 type:complete len:585 (+) Transcript_6795:392-2146(+)|eukprot:CAMPEP_0184541568 /NCGR_PEP_ID=MMETSP0199_2-20130426/1456_1 /TAXON_ID=1112570 /ORGANISM="Thraustochytrium sp., Strain LLF1b" /LENGTH=584 /DNA_ID=CAMNT_0026935301 /DNA_START=355 /DNA_END=2109 /DNA_ORIENTATION=+
MATNRTSTPVLKYSVSAPVGPTSKPVSSRAAQQQPSRRPEQPENEYRQTGEIRHVQSGPPNRQGEGDEPSINELYEVGEELGKGAFSTVYKATHRETGEVFAIKIIQLGKFNPEERHRQEKILDNEITIMRRINDQCEDKTNLIQIKDVVREPSRLAIVMEILEGRELFDRIVQRQRYTEADAAELLRTIATAVRTLHKAGILHRDLKPENLVFTDDSDHAQVKLTDFGLATVSGWPDVHQTVVGTPNYVAPEVVSVEPRGPFYGPPCDVWSMGVILYILLVGYPPFYNDNVRKLFQQIRHGAYEFHREQWEGISPEAKELVSRMLTVDPRKRITIDGVLEHPWMANAPRSELASTLEKMGQLTLKRRFKAAALAIVWGSQLRLRRKIVDLVQNTVANVFTFGELERIHATFEMHTDSQDLMNKQSFTEAMMKLGFERIPVDRMFELSDKNGDNMLDYKEFLAVLASLRGLDDSSLQYCFKIYDTENTGFISKANVTKVLRCLVPTENISLTNQLTAIFEQLDTNNDGAISWEEFRKGVFSAPVLVQSFLEPLHHLEDKPLEDFSSPDADRGIIDPKLLSVESG